MDHVVSAVRLPASTLRMRRKEWKQLTDVGDADLCAFHLDLLPLTQRPIGARTIPRMSCQHARSRAERPYIRSWWRLLIDP
jgi:hypothetical protein